MTHNFTHQIMHASGFRLSEMHLVGYRFEADASINEETGESWVIETTPTKVYEVFHQVGMITGLWRSRAGNVYASWLGGAVYVAPSETGPDRGKIREFPLPAALAGVFGLSDEYVISWGEFGTDGKRMYLWEGKSWREIDSPGLVNAVHGLAPDLLYAVGAKGLVAAWDGRSWKTIPSGTETMLSSVYVASPDEMYAVGPGGRVLHGSIYGWDVLLESKLSLHAVTQYDGRVLVGAGYDGLFELVGNQLKPLDPTIEAFTFDNRQSLLISGVGAIHGTVDLKRFDRVGVEAFAKMAAPHKPSWRP